MADLRNLDHSSERAVAQYLDIHFYPKFATNTIRKDDLASQLAGIDVLLDVGDLRQIKVDEKAATHYVNKNLPTFAFELTFLGRDGLLKNGWLYNEKIQTEFYLLSWIKASKAKWFRTEDITELEVMLISRNKIIQHLAQQGVTKKEAQERALTLRTNAEFGVSGKEYRKRFYYYYTQHLSEKPINIIIRKELLRELSILHVRV